MFQKPQDCSELEWRWCDFNNNWHQGLGGVQRAMKEKNLTLVPLLSANCYSKWGRTYAIKWIVTLQSLDWLSFSPEKKKKSRCSWCVDTWSHGQCSYLHTHGFDCACVCVSLCIYVYMFVWVCLFLFLSHAFGCFLAVSAFLRSGISCRWLALWNAASVHSDIPAFFSSHRIESRAGV